MYWANGLAIAKKKYGAILRLSITSISNRVEGSDKPLGYTPLPKSPREAPFRTILALNLPERTIPLSHEPAFLKVPSYLECCVSSDKELNG